jgi:dolichol kinase
MLTKLELRRKLIHMGSLVIPISYVFVSKPMAIVVLLPVTAFFLSCDIIRRYNQTVRLIYEKHLIGTVVREKEEDRLVGSTYFMIGVSLSVCLLDKPIAILSILVLIVSDTVAALVGTSLGKTPLFGPKTLEGSLAFLLSAVLIVLFYPGVPLGCGLAGAFLATLAESLPLPLDDNVVIPLAMGLTVQGLSLL